MDDNEAHIIERRVLRDILRNGKMDTYKFMTTMQEMSKAKDAFFFEVENLMFWVCRFSTDQTKFAVGVKYVSQDLPNDIFNVYVKDAVVASLTFTGNMTRQTISKVDEILRELHDSLAVAVHFSKTQMSNQKFVVTATNQVFTQLKNMIIQINGDPSPTAQLQAKRPLYTEDEYDKMRIKRTIKSITSAIELVQDVHDYALLTTRDLKLKNDRIDIKDLINKRTTKVEETIKLDNVHVTFTEKVPQYIDFPKARLDKNILQTILLALSNDPHIELEVDVEVTSVAEGNLVLLFKTSTPLPMDLVQVAETRYVIPEKLSLCMARELCFATGGLMRVYGQRQLLFTMGFKFTADDNVIKGKRVIVFIKDNNQETELYRHLNVLETSPTVFSEGQASLYLTNLKVYDLAIVDDYYANLYFDRLKAYGLPVIGLRTRALYQFDQVVESVRERELIDAYKKILTSID